MFKDRIDWNALKDVRTAEQLIDWLKENTIEEKKEWEWEVKWIVSVHKAQVVSNFFGTKDIASLYLNGIEPMTLDGVTKWLNESWEDADHLSPGDEEIKKDTLTMMITIIKDHYNIDN